MEWSVAVSNHGIGKLRNLSDLAMESWEFHHVVHWLPGIEILGLTRVSSVPVHIGKAYSDGLSILYFGLRSRTTRAGPFQAPGRAPLPFRQYMIHCPMAKLLLSGRLRFKRALLSFMSWSVLMKATRACSRMERFRKKFWASKDLECGGWSTWASTNQSAGPRSSLDKHAGVCREFP